MTVRIGRHSHESRSTPAGVAEWQTHRIQNPAPSKACGFDSHPRHFLMDAWFLVDAWYGESLAGAPDSCRTQLCFALGCVAVWASLLELSAGPEFRRDCGVAVIWGDPERVAASLWRGAAGGEMEEPPETLSAVSAASGMAMEVGAADAGACPAGSEGACVGEA